MHGTENKDIKSFRIVALEKSTIISIYKPPFIKFEFRETNNLICKKTQFVIDDLNSHMVHWGYLETD